MGGIERGMSADIAVLPEALPLMGVKVTPFDSYGHAISVVSGFLESGDKAFGAAINPEKIYRASYDQQVRDLLNQAEICICDGVGAALAVRVLYGREIARITGVSLFFELIEAAAEKQWKIFLLGAAPEVNKAAAQKLLEDYTALQIVGRQDGYFEDSDAVIEAINKSGAQLVFVAMGSPKQEIWITENRDEINAPFCMGVGGTFDVVCGGVEWAPAIIRQTGTEWLYRLVKKPSRWKRQLALPKFVWQMLKYKVGWVGK